MTTTAKTRSTTRTPAASQMLPHADYLTTLEANAAANNAMLGVKGSSAKIIPANIRATTRTLTQCSLKLRTYWAGVKNRKAYDLVLESSQETAQGSTTGGAGSTPATKARRAGA
jgi:hypothetical protein